AATVFGIWKLLGQKDSGFGPGDWQFWVAVTVALVPALATLVYVVPAWRARRCKRRLTDWSVKGDAGRPGHFRLGPYGEEDQGEFSRDDGAHAAALARVRGSTAPVFYFTGVSGSGKSSLLAAHVIPNLRADTLVVHLRGSDAPLGRLREALLTPDAVWKVTQAKRHASDDLPALLQAAADHLAG